MRRPRTPNDNSLKWWTVAAIGIGVAAGFFALTTGDSNTSPTILPGDASLGEDLFTTSCLPCHGDGASGTDSGPPLVHELYLPDHHADVAFALAVRSGVRPHHWQFGPMPAVPGLSDQDIGHLIAYVRSLQSAAGLLEGTGS